MMFDFRRRVGWALVLTLIAPALVACAQPLTGRVEARDGRPLVLAGDRPLVSTSCDRFAPAWTGDAIHERNRRMAGLGVDLFQLQLRGDYPEFYTTRFWTDDGVYGDESDDPFAASLAEQARHILDVNPDAVFSIAMFLAPPDEWAKRHPDHMQTSEDGKVWRGASFASDLFLEGVERFIAQVVQYVQRQPWGDRVVGFVLIPHSEGLTELSIYGFPFDQSPVMQQRFAQFVEERHGDAAASITFPTLSRWQNDRRDWLTFPEPAQTVGYRDYFLLQRDLLHEYIRRIVHACKAASNQPVFVVVDAIKQPMSGWMILDAFEGAGRGPEFPDLLLASGSWDVARTVDLPELDGLMTPADYTARSVGLGLEPEGIADSLVLRGKVMMLEDDARSWVHPSFRDEQGAWRNVEEARAGLLRNTALSLSRGFFSHWANVGRGFFEHDDISAILRDCISVRRQVITGPLIHTEHAIAMIIDDEAALHTDFTSGFHQLAVLQQRVHELALTGLPYRVYLMSDLERDDFPRFRMYLFPNLIRLDAERIALIRDKVLRDGAVALFGPATGINDGSTLTAAPASDLLGFPLELVAKRSARRVLVHAGAHPALAHVTAPMAYGDSYEFGPVLIPAFDLGDSGAVDLGIGSVYWGVNRSGLVVREFGKGAVGSGEPGPRGPGDAAVVFSVATPMPAALLRSLALYAGCVPWSDLGDVVHASGDFLSVHSVRSGPRTLCLPNKATVTNLLTGETVATGVDRFTIDLSAPQTRMFRFRAATGERVSP